MQRLISPRRRRTRFMARPRRHRRHGLHRAALIGLAVLAIGAGGSVTASMLGAQPQPKATPGGGAIAIVQPDPTGRPSAPQATEFADPSPAPSAEDPVAPSPTPTRPPPEPSPSSMAGGASPGSGPDTPTRARPHAPLPACATGDMRAPDSDPDEWQTTLLDRSYGLRRTYRPQDLVSVRRAGFSANWRVHPAVIEDLALLRRAARRADAPIEVVSGYRSYQNQATVFEMWRGHLGHDAISASARAGHSEHQLGTSLDFRSSDSYRDPWHYKDWGKTPEGRWLAENSWRYGFVLSYPRGAEAKTCYGYEPWHFRYVGTDVAAAVHESGLTLREYLWEHHASPP